MPWSARTGQAPDFIVNPQAIPSRMTIGHLVECLLAKSCAMTGNLGDGTSFSGLSIDTIGDVLEDSGWHRSGNETYMSGIRGEPLVGEVFVGPTYYQRLKHMVSENIAFSHICSSLFSQFSNFPNPMTLFSRIFPIFQLSKPHDSLFSNISNFQTFQTRSLTRSTPERPGPCSRSRDNLWKVAAGTAVSE